MNDTAAYYDKLVAKKLGDFTGFNPRIEAAIATIAEWAPPKPGRVLEIGCGVGAVTWRMARAWPGADVVGADISRASIEVARACFRRPNLTYRTGSVEQTTDAGRFDLIVLMDVYEHIAPAERAALHAAIRTALDQQARVIMTVPTPAMQAYLRRDFPASLQPVDEDIDLGVIRTFAVETGTEVLQYRQVAIWRYGDYAHLVFGRFAFAAVAQRGVAPGAFGNLLRRGKHLLSRTAGEPAQGYLGCDLPRRSLDRRLRRFQVPAAERRRLIATWIGKASIE